MQRLLVNFAELEVRSTGPSLDPLPSKALPDPICHGAFFLHADLTVPLLVSESYRGQDLVLHIRP